MNSNDSENEAINYYALPLRVQMHVFYVCIGGELSSLAPLQNFTPKCVECKISALYRSSSIIARSLKAIVVVDVVINVAIRRRVLLIHARLGRLF